MFIIKKNVSWFIPTDNNLQNIALLEKDGEVVKDGENSKNTSDSLHKNKGVENCKDSSGEKEKSSRLEDVPEQPKQGRKLSGDRKKLVRSPNRSSSCKSTPVKTSNGVARNRSVSTGKRFVNITGPKTNNITERLSRVALKMDNVTERAPRGGALNKFENDSSSVTSSSAENSKIKKSPAVRNLGVRRSPEKKIAQNLSNLNSSFDDAKKSNQSSNNLKEKISSDDTKESNQSSSNTKTCEKSSIDNSNQNNASDKSSSYISTKKSSIDHVDIKDIVSLQSTLQADVNLETGDKSTVAHTKKLTRNSSRQNSAEKSIRQSSVEKSIDIKKSGQVGKTSENVSPKIKKRHKADIDQENVSRQKQKTLQSFGISNVDKKQLECSDKAETKGSDAIPTDPVRPSDKETCEQ